MKSSSHTIQTDEVLEHRVPSGAHSTHSQRQVQLSQHYQNQQQQQQQQQYFPAQKSQQPQQQMKQIITQRTVNFFNASNQVTPRDQNATLPHQLFEGTSNINNQVVEGEETGSLKHIKTGDSKEEISISLVVNQGLTFIVNNESIPYAQIYYASETHPKFNARLAIDNFTAQTNQNSTPWQSAQAHIHRIFQNNSNNNNNNSSKNNAMQQNQKKQQKSNQSELELAETYIKNNMRDSKILQTLYGILNEKAEKDWQDTVVENLLGMNLRSIEMIQEMLLQDLVSLSLRFFVAHGFEIEQSDLSVFAKVSPLQPILAFVDCFPNYSELVPEIIIKQGIIERSKSSNSTRQNTKKLAPGNNPSSVSFGTAAAAGAAGMTSTLSGLGSAQGGNSQSSPIADSNLAQYLYSFIRCGQLHREAGESALLEGAEKQDEILDPEGRIFLLQGILRELDSSMPTGVVATIKDRSANEFLSKQIAAQIKNTRAVRKQRKSESNSIDRIQSDSDSDEENITSTNPAAGTTTAENEFVDFSVVNGSKYMRTSLNHNETIVSASAGATGAAAGAATATNAGAADINELTSHRSAHRPQTVSKSTTRIGKWNLILEKILGATALDKFEEDQWRYFAFEDNFQSALMTLGEKALIQDKDIPTAIKCYEILYCLGHKQSSTILFSLKCYCGEYFEANSLVNSTTQLHLQKAYSLLKINEAKKAIDLISRSFKNSQQVGSKIQYSYFLTKAMPAYQPHLGALISYIILNKNTSTVVDADIGVIYKMFLIGKLVAKGIYFEQSAENAIRIFDYILNNLTPTYVYEFITLFFVRKNKLALEQQLAVKQTKQQQSKFNIQLKPMQFNLSATGGAAATASQSGMSTTSKDNNKKSILSMSSSSILNTSKNTRQMSSSILPSKSKIILPPLTQPSSTTSSSSSAPIDFAPATPAQSAAQQAQDKYLNSLPWDQFLKATLKTSIEDNRLFLEREHQKLFNIIDNVNTDHDTRRDAHLIYYLGATILFRPDKLYQRSFFDENKSRLMRQNHINCKIMNEYLSPTATWPLLLIKPLEQPQGRPTNTALSTPPNEANDQDIIIESPQAVEEDKNKKQEKTALLFAQQMQSGQLELSGRLTQQLPVRIDQDEIIMTEADLGFGYFSLNRQRFSKWNIKTRYIDQSAPETCLKNIACCVSPYFLNIYAISTSMSCIYAEPYLCSFNQFVSNEIDESALSNKTNTNSKFSSQQAKNSKQESNSVQAAPTKLVKEISGLFQVISLCVALHTSELYGFLSIFGKQPMVLDFEGQIKLPNIINLLEYAFPIDWSTLPHELFLEEHSPDEASKCDVWAVGSILFRMFYGKDIIDLSGSAESHGKAGTAAATNSSGSAGTQSSPSNNNQPFENYLAELLKFKSQEHLDGLFAGVNVPSQKEQAQHSSQQVKGKDVSQQQKKSTRCFEVDSLSMEFKVLLESIIRKCLRFEACSRPSALELLLEVHEFIKKSNSDGIFTQYNIHSVTDKIKSLAKLRFQPQDEPQPQQPQQQPHPQQQQKLNNQQEQGTNQVPADPKNIEQKKEDAHQQQKYPITPGNPNITSEGENQPAKQEGEGNENKQIEGADVTNQIQNKQGEEEQNPNPGDGHAQEPSQVQAQEQEKAQQQSHQAKVQDSKQEINPSEQQRLQQISRRPSTAKNYLQDQVEEAQRFNESFLKQSECSILPGGSVLIQYESKSFYFTTQGTQYHMSPKFKQLSKKQPRSGSLKDALKGEGKLIFTNEERWIEGMFTEYGVPESGMLTSLLTQKLQTLVKKKFVIALDGKTRMPKSESEKSFVEDTKDKQDLFNEHQQLNKIISAIQQNFQSSKRFLDFFGNWVSADFNGANCSATIGSRTSPLLLISDAKTLFVNNATPTKAFLFDYATMTYTIFDDVAAIQLNENRMTTLTSALKFLSNSQHSISHLLEGCRYTGRLENWEPIEGKLLFIDTELEVSGRVEREEVYQTVIKFTSGDRYHGGLLSGRFSDFGRLYKNNRLSMEGMFIDNSMVSGMLYYNDDKISYSGDVFFSEDDNQYKKHGKGQLRYRNGDIYDGFFSLDKYSGFGKILYDGGSKGFFEGSFLEGLKQGLGYYCDKIKGIEYEGDYANNKRCGFGTERVSGVHTYRGVFKDGKKNGQGVIEYERGKVRSYDGGFEEDKKHGEGSEIHENGSQYYVKYWKDGLLSSMLLKKIPSNRLLELKLKKQQQQQDEQADFYSFV